MGGCYSVPNYIPIKLRIAYARASNGARKAGSIPPIAGITPRPTTRKNNHIHQPEIVLGIDIFISHSPLELNMNWPNCQLNKITPIRIEGYGTGMVQSLS